MGVVEDAISQIDQLSRAYIQQEHQIAQAARRAHDHRRKNMAVKVRRLIRTNAAEPTDAELIGLVRRQDQSPAQARYEPAELAQRGTPLTSKQHSIVCQYNTKRLLIEARRRLTIIGHGAVSDIHEHAFDRYDQTTDHILSRVRQARDPKHHRYVEAMSNYLLPEYGAHTRGIVDIGATEIAHILQEPIDVPPPPDTRGWLARLFGVRRNEY